MVSVSLRCMLWVTCSSDEYRSSISPFLRLRSSSKGSMSFWAEGEVYLDGAIGIAGILGAFGQLLLHRGAATLGVFVELQECLWEVSVVEVPFSVSRYSITVCSAPACISLRHPLPRFAQHTGTVETVKEGKLLYMVQYLTGILIHLARNVVGKERLKHPGGGTTGGYELADNGVGRVESLFPLLECFVELLARECDDTLFVGGCFDNMQVGKPWVNLRICPSTC